jgi:hypothetical protein
MYPSHANPRDFCTKLSAASAMASADDPSSGGVTPDGASARGDARQSPRRAFRVSRSIAPMSNVDARPARG